MKRFLLLLISLILFVACGGKDNPPAPPFNVQKLRSDIIKKIETPATNQFVQSVSDLNDKIVGFSKGINTQNLTALKTAWKQATLAYSAIESFNIGDIYDTYIYTALYSWDADENKINGYINDTTKPIDQDKMNARPTNCRGLSAIEFLLFDKPSAEIIRAFSNERRMTYLKVLGTNLKAKAGILKSDWLKYRLNFISNDQTGLRGSINMIVSRMSLLLEDIKGLKIGKPAGLEKRTDSPNTDKLQAEKSEYSLKLVQANIAELKMIYFGKDNSLGLKGYVTSIVRNEKLNAKVKEEFTAIENAISKINPSLKEAIVNQPDRVKGLYDAVKKLLVSVKTDLASILSVTITFSDNDGD